MSLTTVAPLVAVPSTCARLPMTRKVHVSGLAELPWKAIAGTGKLLDDAVPVEGRVEITLDLAQNLVELHRSGPVSRLACGCVAQTSPGTGAPQSAQWYAVVVGAVVAGVFVATADFGSHSSTRSACSL